MIVENLRKVQERHGYLPESELLALAERLGVPLHRLHEVITFFPHFRLRPPAPVEVKVCRDLACHLRGSSRCLEILREEAIALGGPSRVSVEPVSCLGRCDGAPAALIELHRPGHHEQFRVLTQNQTQGIVDRLRAIATAHLEGQQPPADPLDTAPPPWRIDPYAGCDMAADKPYAALARFVALWKTTTIDARPHAGNQLIEALKIAELRGMGGAGVPAFRKWSDVREAEGNTKYIVCNADESEPATFKDRELLLRTPYLIVEGMALAALLVGAEKGYVYIRHEYYDQIRIMEAEIERARELSVVGRDVLGTGRVFELEVYISPGGYVCGEQGALIEALEERRAEPRNRPPQLETNGLFDKPTLLSNVETFAWVPAIALRGGDWYADAGVKGGAWYVRRKKPGAKGLRLFSICGDVARPGVYEVSIGETLGQLIEHAGGMRDSLPLKAIASSGPSGGFIPARLTARDLPVDSRRNFPAQLDELDVRELPLDLDEFRALGLMLGAGLVVYAESQSANMLDQALCASRFFRDESCGKCVPCRVGSQKLVQLADRLNRRELPPQDISYIKTLVDELHRTLELTSICGLGMSAAKPLASTLQSFWKDLGLAQPLD